MKKFFCVMLLAGMCCLPAAIFSQDVPPGLTIHVVQRGENLFRIALSYNLTTDELAQLNGITDPNSIQVGQRLLVPAEDVPLEIQPVQHAVQPGETLRSIATLYDTTPEALAQLNNIADPNAIYGGQVLTITPSTTILPTDVPAAVVAVEPVAAATQETVHVVQSGETLFRIATQYGLNVNALAQANNITDPTLIYVGQELLIPGVEAPALALDLPAPVTGLDLAPTVLQDGKTGRLRVTTSESAAVSATFLDRVVSEAPLENGTLHMLFVAVPIFTDPSVYPLNITVTTGGGQTNTFTVNIQVASGNYGSEYVALPDDKMSLLAPAVEDNEFNILQSISSVHNAERYFDGQMGLPAAAVMNAPFGRQRSYNGGAFDHYHTGADFAGAPGSPILASAAGRVVLADTLYIRGVTTMIDHGWGIYTLYAHQSERYVQLGEMVSAGQTIGTVGSSGRATGAHLHWEVWVSGVPVDPMQWVSQPLF